jgi:hypothetical protein
MDDYVPGGFVLLPRQIRDSWIAHASPATRDLWLWLIMEACHKPMKYNGFALERGQAYIKLSDFREATHWMVGYRKQTHSEDATKKAMKLLRSHQMIASMKAPRGVVVTICNYSRYQEVTNYEGTNEGTSEDPSEALVRHQGGTTINKNERTKEEKARETPVDKNPPGSKQHRFAEKMFERLRQSHPDMRQPNLAKWADVIRLTVERDQRDINDLWRTFVWTADDHETRDGSSWTGWSAVILSPTNLRKNYLKIRARMEATGGRVAKPRTQSIREMSL